MRKYENQSSKNNPQRPNFKKQSSLKNSFFLRIDQLFSKVKNSFLALIKSQQLSLGLTSFLTILFLEMFFQIFTFGFSHLFRINNLFLILFLIPISAFLKLLSTLSKSSIINKIIYLTSIFLLTLWIAIAFGFKKIFNTYFCLSLFGLTDQALAFPKTALTEILKNIIPLAILFLPFITSLLLAKHLNFQKTSNPKKLSTLLILLLSLLSIKVIIYLNKSNENSLYSLFRGLNNNALNVETLGVFPAFYLDLKDLIMKKDQPQEDFNFYTEPTPSTEKSPTPTETYDYNLLDIDFSHLIATENNKTLLSMHKYFQNDPGTLKNKYTGIFKDKNLIVITAESLNTIGIRPDLTPTLYKLSQEGFHFTNFYTPVNLSTIGGEFQNLTSLFANLNDLNKYFRKGTNYFPFGLATVFKNIGYDTKAYHANNAYFQDRNVYLKNMGFDYFKAKNTGLEKLMDTKKWPPSDEEMIEVTKDEYLNSEKFLTYYVSISSHMPYTRKENAIVKKNWDLVKDTDYSDDAKGYLASVIELDKAVSNLLNSLEEAGKLDDTVIAIVPDHYPYSLSLETINELSDYQRDETVEVNHSTLIIWNSKTSSITIPKTASQLDFLPTLYNLFGISYDSRLLMGKDILSTEPGLVYFQNKSWVTDKGTYYASTKKYVPKDDNPYDTEYISKINKIVETRLKMSKLIMENNYYAKIFKTP